MILLKKYCAIALILLFSGQFLFKPGIVTFFELNRDFIASTLCINKEKPITVCYGKCFLDRHLALADEAEQEKAPSPSKKGIEIPVFLAHEHLWILQQDTVSHEWNGAYNNLYQYSAHNPLLRPPNQV